jgi:hypothetical protein
VARTGQKGANKRGIDDKKLPQLWDYLARSTFSVGWEAFYQASPAAMPFWMQVAL